MDAGLQMTLAMLNGAVAVMNACAYLTSRDARDAVSAIAWAGSTAYWLYRVAVG